MRTHWSDLALAVLMAAAATFGTDAAAQTPYGRDAGAPQDTLNRAAGQTGSGGAATPTGPGFDKAIDPSKTGKLDDITSSSVYAELVRVVSGDTMEVLVYPWPQLVLRAHVTMVGIAGPALYEARCDKEKALALDAKAFVEGLPIQKMELYGLRSDEMGRISGFALVRLVGARDDVFLSQLLKERGLVRDWVKGPRPDWCQR